MVCSPNEGLVKVVPLSFQKLCLHMPGIRKKFERRNSPLEYYYMISSS